MSLRALRWGLIVVMLLLDPGVGRALDVGLPRADALLELSAIAPLDRRSSRQRPLGRVELGLEQSPSPRWRYRFAVQGLWGGTREAADNVGLLDFGHTFQNLDPSLELDESYVDYLGDTLDLRLGTQRFSWGRLDSFSPNDILNPKRYHDPLVNEDAEAKIAVPALSASYYFEKQWRASLPDEARIMLVWQPVAVPWRFPLVEERWFPPTLNSTELITSKQVPELGRATVAPTIGTGESGSPAHQLDNGNIALRASARTGQLDWAVSYYDGLNTTPSFTIDTKLLPAIPGEDPRQPTLVADARLRPAYRRHRSVGVDAALPWEAATFRFEAAWRFRRPYQAGLETALQLGREEGAIQRIIQDREGSFKSFVERDSFEWGLGGDYFWNGILTLLEVTQTALIHNHQDLLIKDLDTRLAGSLRRRWLAERLETRLTAIWGIENGFQVARAQVTYDLTDQIQLRAGVLGIWGQSGSIIGQYNENSEAYARVRLHF